jgi:hypothetical protein
LAEKVNLDRQFTRFQEQHDETDELFLVTAGRLRSREGPPTPATPTCPGPPANRLPDRATG